MKPPLDSLAAFKRAASPGTIWIKRTAYLAQTTLHPKTWTPAVTGGLRKKVAHRQSNAIAFGSADHHAAFLLASANPRKHGSWLWFPKASRCSFPDADTIRIAGGDEHHWIEYRRVTHPPAAPVLQSDTPQTNEESHAQ